jgi:hypothetical protein
MIKRENEKKEFPGKGWNSDLSPLLLNFINDLPLHD